MIFMGVCRWYVALLEIVSQEKYQDMITTLKAQMSKIGSV